MPYLKTTDGTSLFFRDWGAGDPVVFVHGWGLNSDMWEYQLPALVDCGLRCVAYDRRGCGRSDQPSDGYEFDTLADDLGALLDHLDLRDVTLVAHSMGSAEVARYLTRHRAGRIGRVALISPTLPYLQRDHAATDLRDDMASFTMPALIVHGDSDALVPFEVSGRRAAAMIADCTLVVYEHASHWPFVTHRERLNADLLAFARSPRDVSPPAGLAAA